MYIKLVLPVNGAIVKLSALCVLLILLSPQLVVAHASIEDRILDVAELLAVDPKNLELYLLRGELYASHKQWSAAEADFKLVLELDKTKLEAHLYLGRLYLAENRHEQAVREVNRYLAKSPDDSGARVTLAKVLAELDRPLEAAEQYDLAIKMHAAPSPDWYLQRAQLLSDTGVGQLEEALQGLDHGIQRFGPLAILQLYAISLEVRRTHFDAALQRLDTLAQQSSRKEGWLQRRAEIMHKAGRNTEALETSQSAQSALGSLSQNKRNTKAMRNLQARMTAFQECMASAQLSCSS